MNLLKHEMVFILVIAVFMIINFWFKSESKPVGRFIIPRIRKVNKTVSELQSQVNKILDQMDKMFPNVNLIHKDNTSCARQSRATIMNPKKKYCVGDTLIVRVEMFDYLKKRKKYGGDYLIARMSSPDIEAGAAGKVEDLKNGTYLVYFTLFWEGKIMVSLFLFHPSEGASALINARNRWYGYIAYTGKFTNKDQQMMTKCGFEHDNSKELCEYGDHRDEEYFYCVKPANYSCDSLTELRSLSTGKSNLTKKETSLLEESNIGVEIPKDFGSISVFNCSKNAVSKERCRIGMELERPAGHFLNNTWYPRSCSMQTYRSMEELNNCMEGKFIHIFGDSTLRQWSFYLQQKLTNLKMLNLYEGGWACPHLGIDLKRNIMFRWKRQTFPFISSTFQSYKEERTITREIDLIGGHQHTVIVFNIGVHFRPHPLHLYIRRLLNIRRAVERLYLRSPQTKVIIKTENSNRYNREHEGCGDFHGYVQYLILEQVFKDANVGFVNGWDMTRAFDAKIMHPPNTYVQNEVDLLMTYIC